MLESENVYSFNIWKTRLVAGFPWPKISATEEQLADISLHLEVSAQCQIDLHIVIENGRVGIMTWWA
jgi:hypothetical protein